MRFHPYWKPPQWWWKLPSIPHLETHLNILESCQNPDGGFGNRPGSVSYMECLFYALVVLGLFGSTKRVYQGALDFISCRQNLDGGFGDEPGRESGLYDAYYALIALNMIDCLQIADRDKTLSYLIPLQKKDGGFNNPDVDESDLVHTFWGMVCLDTLQGVEWVNFSSLITFVEDCHNSRTGGFGSMPGELAYTEYTLEALAILRMCDRLDQADIDWNKTIDFLSRCQNEDGRFGERPGAPSSMAATLWAISGLNILNALEVVDVRKLTRYLTSRTFDTTWRIFCSIVTLIYIMPQEIVTAPRITNVEALALQRGANKYYINLQNISEFQATRSAPVQIIARQSNLDKIISEMDELELLIDRVRAHRIRPSHIDFYSHLKQIGRSLFDFLLPDMSIREEYCSLDRSFLCLGVDESLAFAPFELLYDGTSFACLKHALSRYSISRSAKPIKHIVPIKNNIRVLTICGFGSRWALEECDRLALILGKNPFIQFDYLSDREATRSRIENLLSTKRYDVIQFSGHGVYNEDSPLKAGVELVDGLLTAEIFLELLAKQMPVFLFINACESARSRQKKAAGLYRQHHGFYWPFISEGVPFIGSLFPLFGKSAADFATTFYHYLVAGYPLAEALRLARNSIYIASEGQDFTWASYTFYGNPLLRFTKFGLVPQ